MTSSTMPSADADHVRTRSWAPDPLRPSGPDESTDALLRSLEKALIGTLTDRLGIAASFQSDAEDGDAFDVTSAVDGFVAPVTCRIGAQAGMWLVRQMYGADESTSSGRERELNGPIARRIVNEVLSLFVETFREAASIGLPQHATSAEASSDDIASGASETETVIVNPAAIGVEYVISRQDMARVLSKRRAQTLRRPDRSVEALRAFEDRIETALVRLDATLDEREVSLGEIRRWQIGDLLRLKSSPTSVVDLNIDGRPLFRCELARDDGHFALRLLEERTGVEEGDS